MAWPRRTGDDPSLAPVTVRKPASVRMPARWVASKVTALGVVPVTPLTPYTVASAWLTDDDVPVSRSLNNPEPSTVVVPKLRNSVSIALARSWFHIGYSLASLGRDASTLTS